MIMPIISIQYMYRIYASRGKDYAHSNNLKNNISCSLSLVFKTRKGL